MSLNSNSRPSKRSDNLHPTLKVINFVCAYYKLILAVFFVIGLISAAGTLFSSVHTASSGNKEAQSNLAALREHIEFTPPTGEARRDHLYASVVMVFGVSVPSQASLHDLQLSLREGEGLSEEGYEAAGSILFDCAQKRADEGRLIRNTNVFISALAVAQAASSEEAAAALNTLTTLAPPVVEIVDKSAKIINADTCADAMSLEILF